MNAISSEKNWNGIKKIVIEPKKKYVYVTIKQGKHSYNIKTRKDLFAFDMTVSVDPVKFDRKIWEEGGLNSILNTKSLL